MNSPSSHTDSSHPSLNSEGALMRVANRPSAVMVRGAGSYLWDDRGKRYLDFVQGWAVNALGHAPAEIREALSTQAELLLTPSPAFHNAPQLELAKRLTEASKLAQVHLANSGAEANEAALKLARKWGRVKKRGAFEIITTHNSFHGRTLALMAASGKPGWDQMYQPNLPGFAKVPYDDLSATRAAIGSNTVAIMAEPIQGEAGVVVPKTGYLRGLRDLCDEHDLLLIFDEVQTGIGRSGTLFGFEYEDVLPDILTLGKGLGGGVPISAVLASARASCFEPGDQGGTYNGNPLMAKVGCAVFDAVQDPLFLKNVVETGAYLRTNLERLAARYGASVRGRGLLWAVVLPASYSENLVSLCFEAGLLLNAPRPNLLRLMPSLRVTRSEVDQMISTLEQVWPALASHREEE